MVRPDTPIDTPYAPILYAIAELIGLISPVGGRRIGANVMVYYPSASLTDDEQNRLDQKLRFCDPGIRITKLRGVLDLEKVLTTVIDDSVVKGGAGSREASCLSGVLKINPPEQDLKSITQRVIVC
ncbi:MAG: hypothetical protein GY702_02575 [Desulfobulbaceae bacterium]|nr:hypothetical protein [Desulfobulbaceae bacterium]